MRVAARAWQNDSRLSGVNALATKNGRDRPVAADCACLTSIERVDSRSRRFRPGLSMVSPRRSRIGARVGMAAEGFANHEPMAMARRGGFELAIPSALITKIRLAFHANLSPCRRGSDSYLICCRPDRLRAPRPRHGRREPSGSGACASTGADSRVNERSFTVRRSAKCRPRLRLPMK
jgi:hypothetical protein